MAPEEVKRLLRERGYSLLDVSRMLGCSQSVVSSVVNERATSRRVVRKILELIGEGANVA